jgi:hypothetical protein
MINTGILILLMCRRGGLSGIGASILGMLGYRSRGGYEQIPTQVEEVSPLESKFRERRVPQGRITERTEKGIAVAQIVV